jgi:parallel beta-helix repeat protein
VMFGYGRRNHIENVRVVNSGYHGILVMRNWNTKLLNSVVDTACVRLTDCGGIYTGNRKNDNDPDEDKKPLSLLIEGNTVINIRGSEGIGIYLDDEADGVTVNKNVISNNTQAMVLHNAHDNVITGNRFSASTIRHLVFAQGIPNIIQNNQVTNNTFTSTKEKTFSLEQGDNLKTFATFDHNTYISENVAKFGLSWTGRGDGVEYSYDGWKKWMGQDKNSTMNGKP